MPPIPERLRRLLPRVSQPIDAALDDFALAATLGISRFDAEALLRHLQHALLDDAAL